MLRVENLGKSFGIVDVFQNVNFEVKRGDKVGFVGANGAGKTTLMRCLMGLQEADSGRVALDSAFSFGYVEQQADFESHTLYDEFMSAFSDIIMLGHQKTRLEEEFAHKRDEEKLAEYAKILDRFENAGGYDFESRIRRTAFGLGFTEEDLAKNVGDFSGGQKTRICLAKALLREPDFLLLDEPTNHLDIEMIEWLEKFLQNYSGGVLLISHDRFFLDRVTNRIFELENKTVTIYEGNYTYFMRVKADRREALKSAYAKQQEYIKKTEEYIRKYKAGIKSKQARGRQSQLNRMERIVLAPEAATFKYFALSAPAICAERVVEFEDVSFGYNKENIFEHIDLLVRRGDGIALVGANGAGKTTLLKVLTGELTPRTGRIKLGSRVKLAYFSQHHEELNPANTLVDEIMYEYGIDEESARSYLGAFLFHGDDVFRRIGELSGGEQSRIAFLKMMLTGANFLVLDEPTNHLDIPSKEAVEEALMSFPGTFLAVSHDRYFLDKVANTTLELADGNIVEYLGNYSYYRTKKALIEEERQEILAEKGIQNKKGEAAKGKNKVQLDLEERKNKEEEQERSRIRSMSDEKRADMIVRAEADILMAEADIKGIEYTMNLPEVQSDPARSEAIAKEYEEKVHRLEECYKRWEMLSEA